MKTTLFSTICLLWANASGAATYVSLAFNNDNREYTTCYGFGSNKNEAEFRATQQCRWAGQNINVSSATKGCVVLKSYYVYPSNGYQTAFPAGRRFFISEPGIKKLKDAEISAWRYASGFSDQASGAFTHWICGSSSDHPNQYN